MIDHAPCSILNLPRRASVSCRPGQARRRTASGGCPVGGPAHFITRSLDGRLLVGPVDPAGQHPPDHLAGETAPGQETHAPGAFAGVGRRRAEAAAAQLRGALQLAVAQLLQRLRRQLQPVLGQFALDALRAHAGRAQAHAAFDETLLAQQPLGLQRIEQPVDLRGGVGLVRPQGAQGLSEGTALLGKEAPPYISVPTLRVKKENLLSALKQVTKEDPPASVIKLCKDECF